MSPENRSNEDAAQLIAAHDAYPPQGPWDECDGCHVEYVRSLLARIAAVEAEADRWDGGVEAGRAHVAACQIHPCPRCVVAEAAIDLRAVLTEGAI